MLNDTYFIDQYKENYPLTREEQKIITKISYLTSLRDSIYNVQHKQAVTRQIMDLRKQLTDIKS